jgi:hypothetical protein
MDPMDPMDLGVPPPPRPGPGKRSDHAFFRDLRRIEDRPVDMTGALEAAMPAMLHRLLVERRPVWALENAPGIDERLVACSRLAGALEELTADDPGYADVEAAYEDLAGPLRQEFGLAD